MINDHKTIRVWRIMLITQINFILHKDSEETRTMYTKSCKVTFKKYVCSRFLCFEPTPLPALSF